MQQTEKYWNMILRWSMAVVAGMLLFGAVLMFLPQVRRMQAYQDTRDTLQQRIETTLADEQQTKQNIQRFKSDPVYVERVAHAVGYAHKDEVIYHFLEESGEKNF